MTTIDPITLSVLRGRLEQICDEMDATLFRAAFSPAIAEARDASHALYDAQTGGLLVQGKGSLPIFIGSMSFAVKGVIDKFGPTFADGDVYITNDPYLCGTHLNDFKLVRPVFSDGRLVCCLASSGHWADVGGNVAGNFNATATETYQEGVLIPPVKLVDRGRMSSDIVDILMAMTRLPTSNYGDMNGQVNALEAGAAGLLDVIREYGLDPVLTTFREVTERAAVMARSFIAELPDGTYSFDDFLDNDGIVDEPLRIALDMTIRGDEMTLDFSRSAGPCAGPMNISYASTVAGCYVAFKHAFPEVPANTGCLDPVRIIVPEDSLLNAKLPTPISGYTEVVTRVIDVVFGAMSKADPENAVGAPHGTLNVLSWAGKRDDGRRWAMVTFFGGGFGGSAISDGLNNGNAALGMANTPPAEIIEAAFPVMFTQWALRPDSGGAGANRGGLGCIFEAELLEGSATAAIFGERTRTAPHGVGGGVSARSNHVTYEDAEGRHEIPLGAKLSGLPIHAGGRMRIESPGGGGFGEPNRRAPEKVRRDVAYGYITAEAAMRDYGLPVTPPPALTEATATSSR
jgi:N-methylhydantoinase B